MSHWKAELNLFLKVEPEGLKLWSWNWTKSVVFYKALCFFPVSNLSEASQHPYTLLCFFFFLLSSTRLLSVWKNILVNCWLFPCLISLPLLFECIFLAFWPLQLFSVDNVTFPCSRLISVEMWVLEMFDLCPYRCMSRIFSVPYGSTETWDIKLY